MCRSWIWNVPPNTRPIEILPVRFAPPPLLDGYPEIAIEKNDGRWTRFAFALD
jgi:hypothetical protein